MSASPLNKWRAMSYCLLWYLSIVAGYTLLWAPTLPLLLIHRPTYRRITDVLATIWETFNVVSINQNNISFE